jgi:AcrR family transcriptional regulator
MSRAEQVEQNRAAVLTAAKRVFLDRGYAGATLEAIAEEAGFSKGVVYSQFAGKADLFLALLDGRITERAADNERVVMGMAGPAALMRLLDNFERDTLAEAGWVRVLIEFRAVAMRDPELNRRYAESHRRSVETLAELIGRLYASAELEPPQPPRMMAEFIFAIGSGLALERAANPSALPSLTVKQILGRSLELGQSAQMTTSIETPEVVR